MIKYNIKQAIRGMMRNKTFTFLNISGFAVGFSICIIIMIFAYKEYSMDSSFANANRIYRLVDAETKSVTLDRNIVPKLESVSGVEMAVPIFYANWADQGFREFLLDTKSGKSIETKGGFITTNNDFFKLFGVKTIVSKAEQPFADKKSIVLTKSVAMKLYGTLDVINKQIKKEDAFFTVSAVVENMPENSSLNSIFFIRDDNPDYEVSVTNFDNGKYYPRNIYLLTDKKSDTEQLTANLSAVLPQNIYPKTKKLNLQPLKDIYFNHTLNDNDNKTGNKSLIYVFLAIALLTLLMSIFNYANFMISRQMAALKNSGVRVTSGALRSQIRAYYLTEIVIAVLVAFALALLIAQIAMPFAEQLLGTKLGLSWLLQAKLFGIFLSLFVVVVSLSAIAPIGFISRLKIQTLFGKTSIKSRKHPIKIVMNITQLTVAMVLLIAVFTVSKQLHYVKSVDLGFQTSHLLRLNIPWDYEKYDVMKSEFSKLPFIEKLSQTSHMPGAGWSTSELKDKDGNPVKVYMISVDKDFLNTFDLKLLRGRTAADNELNKAFYFTDYTYKKMGWENLEDIKLRKDAEKETQKVIGVVNDVFYNSLHSKMVPVAFFFSNFYYGDLNLKLAAGNLTEQMAEIKKVWKKVFGNEPFSFNFYDQYFDSLYKKEANQAQALTLFSVIAIIITCLGLLGQILQATQNRIKEIGVRKINGASIKEVMLLLNKDFIRTIIIAFVIATPTAYYVMSKWLENFAYKTDLSWWIFALAGVVALVVALLTVSWQSYRAASRNPVEALRYE